MLRKDLGAIVDSVHRHLPKLALLHFPTNGLLPDAAVKESRDRVTTALNSSGFKFSYGRTTINLAPADLPKEGGRFDLPIALGILAAAGHIDAARLRAFEFAGELSLAGELRPVRGALALGSTTQLSLIHISEPTRPY